MSKLKELAVVEVSFSKSMEEPKNDDWMFLYFSDNGNVKIDDFSGVIEASMKAQIDGNFTRFNESLAASNKIVSALNERIDKSTGKCSGLATCWIRLTMGSDRFLCYANVTDFYYSTIDSMFDSFISARVADINTVSIFRK